MHTAHKHFVITAVDAIEDAIREILFLLPPRLQMQHAIACRHAPDGAAAWESIRWKMAAQQETPDEGLQLQLLDELVMLSRAIACLRILLLDVPTQPPNLSLPKVRGPQGQ